MIANSNTTTITSHIGNVVAYHWYASIVSKRLQRCHFNPLWLQVSIHTIWTSNLCNHWEILTLSQEERRRIKKNTTRLLVSRLDREAIEVEVTIVRGLCLLRITCRQCVKQLWIDSLHNDRTIFLYKAYVRDRTCTCTNLSKLWTWNRGYSSTDKHVATNRRWW